MPKSAIKSASMVDSDPAVAAQPTEATKNGKRDAEEIIEKNVVSGKKQKTGNEGVACDVEKTTEKKEIEKQENSSLESEEEEKKEPKKPTDMAKNGDAAARMKVDLNNESKSDEADSVDEEEPKKPADVAKNGDVAAKKMVDSDDESKSDDADRAVEVDSKAASEAEAPVKPDAKVQEEGNGDREVSDEEPAEPQAVKEKASGSEEGLKEEDDGSKEEEPKTTKKDDADVEMVDAPSAEKAPQTPATPQATGSKILFMGNLNFSIEENDVLDFFKDAGEIVEVRFAMREDRFAGFAHVEFATPEAAQKALKLDKELLLDRAVRLELSKERGAHTPNIGGQSQGLTVFVRGFGTDDGLESVRSTLEKHFGQCGEITRMSIPKDHESRGLRGVAFMDFNDSNAFNKALELSGTEVSGGTIIVEEAKQRGSGGGGFGRGRGGRSGGRDGGWSGVRGRYGGRDGGRGHGRGRGR